jgi:hypothetical protein
LTQIVVDFGHCVDLALRVSQLCEYPFDIAALGGVFVPELLQQILQLQIFFVEFVVLFFVLPVFRSDSFELR